MKRTLDQSYLASSVGLTNPRDPVLVDKNISIKEAIKILGQTEGGAILIVNDTGKLAGIFTERDAIKKVINASEPMSSPISRVMTKSPSTIQMTTAIGFALQLMSQGGFRHLPIVGDKEDPIGILSIKDIIDEIVSSFIIGN